MKKVGIITLNGYFNYGNRLQNYALQQVLQSLGFQAETIVYHPSKAGSGQNLTNWLGQVTEFPVKAAYKKLVKTVRKKIIYKKLNERRTAVFKEFTSKYIKEVHYNELPDNIGEQYDFFITGSDQVWNPYYRHGSPVEFLTFAPKYKRIAYAPSFGVEEIPEDVEARFTTSLTDMHRLSVREEAGAAIIKKLTGREAQVVLDPTLLLQKEDWLHIKMIPSQKPMTDYLLTYFLGDISKERKNWINSLAKERDLKVIHLANPQYSLPYVTGPDEFIDYIHGASMLLTDSFHGAIFSILMETPFIACQKKVNEAPTNSRFHTLLKTFGLEAHQAENITTSGQLFTANYEHITPVLEKKREEAISYLQEALK